VCDICPEVVDDGWNGANYKTGDQHFSLARNPFDRLRAGPTVDFNRGVVTPFDLSFADSLSAQHHSQPLMCDGQVH